MAIQLRKSPRGVVILVKHGFERSREGKLTVRKPTSLLRSFQFVANRPPAVNRVIVLWRNRLRQRGRPLLWCNGKFFRLPVAKIGTGRDQSHILVSFDSRWRGFFDLT
jgi:hypothetical protein